MTIAMPVPLSERDRGSIRPSDGMLRPRTEAWEGVIDV